MKKPKKRNETRTPDVTGAGPPDWTPMFQAFREAFEWALDVAKTIARDYPEEIEAVERVRAFMRKRIAGETSHIDTDDVLFTFALIIGAMVVFSSCSARVDAGHVGIRVKQIGRASCRERV